MEWIEHNRRWLAIVILVIGGLSLIAGIGFVVLDNYLVKEYHANAATIMQYYNEAISAFGDMSGAVANDQLFNGIGSIVSVFAQGSAQQYIEGIIDQSDPQTQLVIRGARLLLPWVPYKVWFILFGLVFTGIGLALLLDKLKWKPHMKQWLHCHACGKASLVGEHAQFCPICGAPARFAPEPAPAPSPRPSPKPAPSPVDRRAYCPKCHSLLAEGSRFCGVCGYGVSDMPAERVCERCGMRYPRVSATCPYCAEKWVVSHSSLSRGGDL